MVKKEVAFDSQNNDKMNFVKRYNRKKGINLNTIIVNLTEKKVSPRHRY